MHTHNTHALFIYFYTAEILDEVRKNKFEKPTPIQVFNLYDWTGLCNHLCVNLKKYIYCSFFLLLFWLWLHSESVLADTFTRSRSHWNCSSMWWLLSSRVYTSNSAW